VNEQSQRIRQVRAALGLGLREFARKVGISSGYLSDLEHGKQTPSSLLIAAVALRCSVSERWIETGEGPMLLADRAPAREAEPQDPKLAELVRFLMEWWEKADDDTRGWLRHELRRLVPEFDDWLKQRGPK